jgi:hypothetical protein
VIATSVLHKAMRQIAAKKGAFTLFALFRRADAPAGNWDLVVSAPWLESGTLKATGDIINLLVQVIGREAVNQIARVEVIAEDSPIAKFILANLPLDEENRELRVQSTDLFGLEIEEGIIFRAKRGDASKPGGRSLQPAAAGSSRGHR